jgi:methylmalonyl-CoA/ethylmalonyl-CoA epimerase
MAVAVQLDHLAIGTRALADGWDLFGGVLGGTWAYGGDAPGFWWGQLRFSSGPKVELLTPAGGPDSAFLERFLATRAAGPHHFNFSTPDIQDTLAEIAAQGIEPAVVNLGSDTWKEAFLHPKSAYGIVIQVAQQAGPAPSAAPPAELPAAGPASSLDLIEYHVTDLAGATRLFRDALGGQPAARAETAAFCAAELAWPGGKLIRLVQPAAGGDQLRSGGVLHHVRFSRPGGFSAAEAGRAALLSARLGVTVELAGA